MNLKDLTTLEQIEAFVSGTQAAAFEVGGSKDRRYEWVQATLRQHHYRQLGKHDRGLIRVYLGRVTGYSRATVTRLIEQYARSGRVRRRQRTTNGFRRRFTPADIRLLAQMDELHDTPNGYAMKKLCERALDVFDDARFERLARISVSHLYRLRKTTTYRRRGLVVDKTRPREVAIGERRAPQANGEPGYLRVDSVHQGDFDKRKGVYHVNAVDETTQCEIVTTVERISEHYLIPALQSLMDQFPFKIQGFHTDNGSEYINYRVAGMLNKLLIEFTKSRRRTSNDNALVEGKNGSVVRKIFGHAHIPQHFAERINTFNREYLNPHLNFHRPCLFARTRTDSRGKQKKVYPYGEMYTPYEKFKSLADAHRYLKPGMNFETLDASASSISDNESARRLKAAYRELNQHIHGPDRQRA